MYANHHLTPSRFNPAGLGAAIAINAAVVAALIFAAPHVEKFKPSDPISVFTDPLDPPPPPEPQPQPKTPPVEKIFTPVPPLDLPTKPIEAMDTTDTLPPTPPSSEVIGKADPLPIPVEPPPTPLPALVEPSVDQRYAADLQPMYPPAERRAGREGSVTIRVLIGVDGRVKEAQQVRATSDDFWRATLDRALAKWRFKPGTRGGVPVEAWRTMTLRFVLKDGM
jgi:protein TonB